MQAEKGESEMPGPEGGSGPIYLETDLRNVPEDLMAIYNKSLSLIETI